MTKLQILSELEKFYGDTLSLRSSLEILETIVITLETLEEEGLDFNMTELIHDTVADIMSNF